MGRIFSVHRGACSLHMPLYLCVLLSSPVSCRLIPSSQLVNSSICMRMGMGICIWVRTWNVRMLTDVMTIQKASMYSALLIVLFFGAPWISIQASGADTVAPCPTHTEVQRGRSRPWPALFPAANGRESRTRKFLESAAGFYNTVPEPVRSRLGPNKGWVHL